MKIQKNVVVGSRRFQTVLGTKLGPKDYDQRSTIKLPSSKMNLETLQSIAFLPVRFGCLLIPWWMKPNGWRRNVEDILFFARILYLNAYTSSRTGFLEQPPAATQRRGRQALLQWKLVHMVEWMDEVGTTLLWALFLFLLFCTASVPLVCITTQLVLLFNRVFATPPPPQDKKTQVIIDETDPQYGMLRQRKGKEARAGSPSATTSFTSAPSLTDAEQKRYEELVHSPVAQNLRMVAILPHRIAVAVIERFIDFVRYRLLGV
jgi:hypothetical protein